MVSDTATSPLAILMAVLTLTLTLVSILLFFYVRSSRKRSRVPGLPPGPVGLPLLGSLPFLDPGLHRFFTNLARAYGPVLSLRLGTKLCVVLSSPSAAREVLKDNDAIFANRDQPAATRVVTFGRNDLLWAPYGPLWRTLRKVCVRELLGSPSVEAFRPLRRRQVRRAIAGVRARVGVPVQVPELMFLTSLNVMMSMLWGVTVDRDDDGENAGREFMEVIQGIVELLLAPNISDFFPALAALDLQGLGRKMKRLAKRYDRLLEEVVGKRAKRADGEAVQKRTLLEVMLELVERGDPQAPLNMEHVGGLLLNLVQGGTETTSSTVEWAMAELLLHPEVMRKSQEELDTVVSKDRVVEESDIPKLSYLDAVVKETLRLHPVLPLLVPHSPSSSCTVAQYTIPKGSQIFVNIWAIHRDPSIWEEPHEFKPERFLKAAEKYDYNGNNFSYLPFGSGRRGCVGLILGERMVMYMLASLLHSFDWKLPDDANIDLAEKLGIILQKAKPLNAIPMVRLDKPGLYA